MALPIPSLDDRTYEQLRRDLVAEIPLIAKDWTDHNPSDPGIALLELLAAMAEMILYRLDQIPDAVYENFLRMVVDRPEPVTADVRFTRRMPSAELTELPAGVVLPPELAERLEHQDGRLLFHGAMSETDRDLLLGLSSEADYQAAILELFADSNRSIVIPAGTRVSGPETTETFETVREATIPSGELDSEVVARHLEEVEERELGVSDETPGQAYELLPPRRADSEIRPVLLDPLRQGSAIYNPNPEITVGDERWHYVQDLLESGPDDAVFTVEWLTYKVRFGDGVRGRIPSAGAAIRCRRHQVVCGKEVQVAAGRLTELVRTQVPLETLPFDPSQLIGNVSYNEERKLLILAGAMTAPERDFLLAISPDDAYGKAVQGLYDLAALQEITNPDDATGGRFLFDMETAGDQGLHAALKEPERAITSRDFTDMATKVFNELNGLPGPEIKRAHARRLDDAGTVVVVIIPESERPYLKPTKELKDKVYRFLNQRRLITTRLLIADPRYCTVRIEVTIAARANLNTANLSESAEELVNRFYDPLNGGPDGEGWPLGRAVYRSELHHVLSDLEGVDYVPSLILNGSSSNACVKLGPFELPEVIVDHVSIVGGQS